ncbi:MAG: hypothetical protein HYZ54_10655 [Ignavibacteriae bacterium]|nr:hypothetical protein [Ignavibacteriota bacterium]
MIPEIGESKLPKIAATISPRVGSSETCFSCEPANICPVFQPGRSIAQPKASA